MRIKVTPGKVRRLLQSLGQITTKGAILEGNLSDEEVAAVAGLYPPWRPGEVVQFNKDDMRNYEGALYKLVIGHTTQVGWEPPIVPNLWTPIVAAGVIPEWTQPSGAQDAFALDAQVTHDNPNDDGSIWIYQSKIPANTSEPGRDGTFDRWWEPIESA